MDNAGYTPGEGILIGGDEIVGVIYQRMKLIHGVDGINDGDVANDNPLPIKIAAQTGVWGYNAGIAGTLTLIGGKKVLRITAIALEVAASFTINGGDAIIIPYGATDKVSSSIEFEPKGNLVNPVITFTNTKAFLVEYVT